MAATGRTGQETTGAVTAGEFFGRLPERFPGAILIAQQTEQIRANRLHSSYIFHHAHGSNSHDMYANYETLREAKRWERFDLGATAPYHRGY